MTTPLIADYGVALIEAAKAMAEACTAEALRHTFGVELQPGERYAGTLLRDDGTPSHHVVLLPGSTEAVKWPAALQWAIYAGGDLPTRREHALLFANCPGAFAEAWHWSVDESDDGAAAWYQVFHTGTQGSFPKSYEGHARAVRRVLASPATSSASDNAPPKGDTHAPQATSTASKAPPAAKKKAPAPAARRG